jgi:hypothetical protein
VSRLIVVVVYHCGLTPLKCTHFELTLLAKAVTNLILPSPIIAKLLLLDYSAFTELPQLRCRGVGLHDLLTTGFGLPTQAWH